MSGFAGTTHVGILQRVITGTQFSNITRSISLVIEGRRLYSCRPIRSRIVTAFPFRIVMLPHCCKARGTCLKSSSFSAQNFPFSPPVKVPTITCYAIQHPTHLEIHFRLYKQKQKNALEQTKTKPIIQTAIPLTPPY